MSDSVASLFKSSARTKAGILMPEVCFCEQMSWKNIFWINGTYYSGSLHPQTTPFAFLYINFSLSVAPSLLPSLSPVMKSSCCPLDWRWTSQTRICLPASFSTSNPALFWHRAHFNLDLTTMRLIVLARGKKGILVLDKRIFDAFLGVCMLSFIRPSSLKVISPIVHQTNLSPAFPIPQILLHLQNIDLAVIFFQKRSD